MTQIYRTRPPQGTHLDFAVINILLSVIMFIGFGLVAAGYHIVGFCMAGATALGIVFCIFRAWAFDRHVLLSATPIVFDDTTPDPITQTQYAQQTNTPAGQVLTYSNITLPDSDWLKIAGLLIRNGTISRDDMVRLGLLRLTEKALKGKLSNGLTGYEDFITKATAAGWVKLEKGQRVLTDSGRVHFMSVLYPPTPSANPDPSVAHEATTDGDDAD